MKTTATTPKFLAVALIVLSLTACGGGGGGSSPAAANPPSNPPPSPVLTVAELYQASPYQPSAASVVSAPGTPAGDFITALNAARTAAGLSPLNEVLALDTAAEAHNSYLQQNPTAPFESLEIAGLPGFTGASPIDQMAAAGYRTGNDYANGGVGAADGQHADGATAKGCLDTWLADPQAAAVLLGAYRDVGFAIHVTPGSGGSIAGATCTFQIAVPAGAAPALTESSAAVWPATGSTVSAGSMVDGAGGPNGAGYPITVMLGSYADLCPAQSGAVQIAPQGASLGAVTVTSSSLKDAFGNLVPATLFGSPGWSGVTTDPAQAGGTVDTVGAASALVLSPSALLVTNATYTAEINVTVTCAGGKPQSQSITTTFSTNSFAN